MSDTPNLDAYFERIGYGGPAEPTLEVLAALVRSQVATIPYEGVDVFMKKPIDLGFAAIERKLVDQRRGGYCYELNGLFRGVVRALGFEVTNLIGRTLLAPRPDGLPTPRAHMVLKVRAEGEDWLVDVGNAGVTPTAPLQWRYDVLQQTPHGAYRLLRDGADTRLELEAREGVRPIVSLSPEPQLDVDFELANWHASTHPSSWFVGNLVCSMSPDTVRLNLLNNRLTVRSLDAEPQEMFFDVDGLERCLAEVFGLPVEPEWREYLWWAIKNAEEAAA